MPINSRAKGARGERAWRDKLRSFGYDAERGQQRAGGPDSPDVKCPQLDWIHFEVKCVEALNIHNAIAQAQRDAASHQVPVVAHKRNRGPWLVTLLADQFLNIIGAQHGQP
jgi:hypothetical protein